MKKSLCKIIMVETNNYALLVKGIQEAYDKGFVPVSGMIASRPDTSILVENKYKQLCMLTIDSVLKVKEMMCLTNAVVNNVSLVNIDNLFHPIYNTNGNIIEDLKIASFNNHGHMYDNVVKIDNHYFTYILQSYNERCELGVVFDKIHHEQRLLSVDLNTGILTLRVSIPNLNNHKHPLDDSPKEKPSSTELRIKLTSVITDVEWR